MGEKPILGLLDVFSKLQHVGLLDAGGLGLGYLEVLLVGGDGDFELVVGGRGLVGELNVDVVHILSDNKKGLD